MLRLNALVDRMRESLFLVPAAYIAAGVAGAVVLVRADRLLGDSVPLLLHATVDSARATLSTLAGATITVAGIVFSVTVVSVQLASSQFSPRVLRAFLRDRLAQHVIGIVVGTFTYTVLVLTSIRGPFGGTEQAAPTAAVTAAVVLGVVAVIAIIAFIDHSTRAMQVGRIIQRVTDETRALIAHRLPPDDPDTAVHGPRGADRHDGPGGTLRAPRDGWIQQLDERALLRALPAGATARLEVDVGDHVVEDGRLATVWPADALDAVDHGDVVAIGDARTMQEDIAFGLRQLVDIALRALSPGVNDPTTAYEALAGLTTVLSDLLRRDLPPRVVAGDDGRVVHRARAPSHDDYVDRSFDQIRIAARGQAGVLIALLSRLRELEALLDDAGTADGGRSAVRRQASLVVDGLDGTALTAHDRARVRAVAADAGLVAEPDAG